MDIEGGESYYRMLALEFWNNGLKNNDLTDYAEAIKLYTMLMEKYPDVGNYPFSLSMISADLKDYESALKFANIIKNGNYDDFSSNIDELILEIKKLMKK